MIIMIIHNDHLEVLIEADAWNFVKHLWIMSFLLHYIQKASFSNIFPYISDFFICLEKGKISNPHHVVKIISFYVNVRTSLNIRTLHTYLWSTFFFQLWGLNGSTDSTKINRPVHRIRMYWTNYRQPTAHVQQNIFGKTLTEVCSLHLYASFGTFCVQIGQFFEAQWYFKLSEEFEINVIFLRKHPFNRFQTYFKDSVFLE